MDINIIFGTLILWNGSEGIVQSRLGEWYCIDRTTISPWHVFQFQAGIDVSIKVDGENVVRAEHIDGQWDWLKVF
jgi:hypothetical protein